MKTYDVLQLLAFFGLLIGLAPLLGRYMAKVFAGEGTFLGAVFAPVERWIYRLGGVRAEAEMSWKQYFAAVLIFNVVGILTLMALQMTQGWQPLMVNPQKLPNVPWALALNTAISFITNTNWQAYSGENTMSYLTQMAGLAVHNFLSAATGIAVLLALARGLKRAGADARQFLGGPDARDALRAAPALRAPRGRAGRPGRGADVQALCDR
jgi:K+-transporting ATPase ATPase A chain